MTGRAHALDDLRAEVCAANLRLAAEGLVTLTWGNVSGRSADGQLIAIKPSGVPYTDMRPEHMVVVTLDGDVFDGALRPSTDTATHLELYRNFPGVGAVVHAHSTYATAFAQARCPIACLGTTHADHFAGTIPVTRPLTRAEVTSGYERATGAVIVEHYRDHHLDPQTMPAVLVAAHAPFTWGPNPGAAVDNAVALEAVANLAALTASLGDGAPPPLEPWVLDLHHDRKHGPGAYYGQAPTPRA